MSRLTSSLGAADVDAPIDRGTRRKRARRSAPRRSRATARTRRSRRTGYMLSGPALGAVALVTLLPIAFSIYMSFTEPAAGTHTFTFTWVGLANYKTVLRSDVFWHAVVFTVL